MILYREPTDTFLRTDREPFTRTVLPSHQCQLPPKLSDISFLQLAVLVPSEHDAAMLLVPTIIVLCTVSLLLQQHNCLWVFNGTSEPAECRKQSENFVLQYWDKWTRILMLCYVRHGHKYDFYYRSSTIHDTPTIYDTSTIHDTSTIYHYTPTVYFGFTVLR
ncbi:unnamed protein product [Darwinula stevensoni]|uniref:Uncharacterized protein n=1 Tax=Darwinula stevensoni TaxID=69355 RepID=A0A7R8X7M1_9CRUS|nr:unnamed protein product [Darwinula stevensoni]CAG0882490.1 unnamed protein product [Darwinula stevensoni]